MCAQLFYKDCRSIEFVKCRCALRIRCSGFTVQFHSVSPIANNFRKVKDGSVITQRSNGSSSLLELYRVQYTYTDRTTVISLLNKLDVSHVQDCSKNAEQKQLLFFSYPQVEQTLTHLVECFTVVNVVDFWGIALSGEPEIVRVS